MFQQTGSRLKKNHKTHSANFTTYLSVTVSDFDPQYASNYPTILKLLSHVIVIFSESRQMQLALVG